MGEAELYKLTYRDLVLLCLELKTRRRLDEGVYDRNIAQARRIMELEFDLRKYRSIMVEDQQEAAVKEYGVAMSNVVSNEELVAQRLKRKGGGGNPPEGDWLSGMAWGTEFRCRPKQQKTWLLATMTMGGILKGTVLIIPHHGDEISQDMKEWMWVDPVKFCEYWEHIATVMIPKEDEDE